jgi:hypothetical protein
VTASEGSIFAFVDVDLLPLGSSMQTTQSQNAIRKKKEHDPTCILPGSLLLPLS